jgi:Ca2+-binding EF-hand superfamily protein
MVSEGLPRFHSNGTGMDEGVVKKISEWSEGKVTDEVLLEIVEASRPSLGEHQEGFTKVVGELNAQQLERCEGVIALCNDLMEMMFSSLDDLVEALSNEDRNAVFIAGDTLNRASFQLNEAFVEFRNHSLAALGPSDIPNLNLLLLRRDEMIEDPSDESIQRFQEAIDSERITTYHSLEDLAKEPDLVEVQSLINCFRGHMSSLNKLAGALEEDGEEADYDSLFAPLEQSFLELQELVPMVQIKLRTTGETDYPDLNYLLTVMEDLAQGNIGDAPVMDALAAVDEAFTKSKELMAQAAGNLDSALANDEAEAVLETFEEFEDAMEAIYNFFEMRDRALLVEGKGCLIDFAKRFAAHQKKFKEIEKQQGQVLCPMCSTANEVTRTRCSKCGGPLPQNVAAAATTTFETQETSGLEQQESEVFITTNLAKLYKAVNQVADGTINHDEFLEAVTKFESILEANVGNLPPEPEAKSDEAREAIGKVYDAFEEGVEKLRSAIDVFRTYPTHNDEEILAQAVLRVDEGAKLIAAAGETVQAAT